MTNMPPVETYKIINDPVHGYIELTKLEHGILQLATFNRLHHTKQMSMAYLVYPGAHTTRFVHSVGVLHVASKMIRQLIESTNDNDWLELFGRKSDSRKRQIIQTVRLSALLHDVGHGPFSHATEQIMLKGLQSHSAEFDSARRMFGVSDGKDIPVHEYYSVKLIRTGEIKEAIEQAGISSKEVTSLLLKDESSRLSGCTKEGTAILRKVVSSQLDADRMDNLLRDSFMTGAVYGMVDINRLISNLLIRKQRDGSRHLVVHERGLDTVEDVLDARYKMYRWIYNHHMVVACNELLKRAILELIHQNKLSYQDFYWGRFSKRMITEDYIMSAIVREIAKDKPTPFDGLMDRRFLPVSLLKRPIDHENFLDLVNKELPSKENIPALLSRVRAWFEKYESREEISLKGEARRPWLLAVNSPRTPYKPLMVDRGQVVEKDKIRIWDQRERTSYELTKVSPYFRAVNQVWSEFPSFYFAYVFPGKPKSWGAKPETKKRVLNALVEEVAAV